MLVCYNRGEGAITGMKQYTKQEIMSLTNEELLQYINQLLKSGSSLSQLEKETGVRRQTIRDRLKKEGYIFNKTSNSYIKHSDVVSEPLRKPQEAKKTQEPRITMEELLKRIEALEMRLNDIEKLEENIPSEFKPMVFDSEVQPRNYPLHKEVTDLLSQVSKAHPQFKVKDIVNHCLYIGLSHAIHSDNIEKA